MASILPPLEDTNYSHSLIDGASRSHSLVWPDRAIPPVVITALLDVFVDFIRQCLGMQQTAQAAAEREAYMRAEMRSGSKRSRRWFRKMVNRSDQYRRERRRDRKLIADQLHLDAQSMTEAELDELFAKAKQ